MKTYIITEKQNKGSSRDGETIQARNLASAKRKASKSQMFQGTILEIQADHGELLAQKEDGNWTNFRTA